MLEEVPTARFEGPTYRLVNQSSHVEYLRNLGLDVDQSEEMLSFLRERGISDDPIRFLDGPFAAKPLLRLDQTRFSDGTLRVFYSALEVETVEQEIKHWYLKPILEGRSTSLRMYYRLFSCKFEGATKDLRPKIEEWPFLVADDGYDQCNDLAREAVASGIAGLLSQSARRVAGTTLPVFSRQALSDVVLQNYRVLDFDPATTEVTVLAG